MNNYRIFVEKKKEFQIEAKSLIEDFNVNLNENIKGLRLIHIYDVFNIDTNLLEKAVATVFSEVVTDNVYYSFDLNDQQYIAVEYLPGQFDQTADSAMQLISLIDTSSKVIVKSGTLLLFDGEVNLNKIKDYYIQIMQSLYL